MRLLQRLVNGADPQVRGHMLFETDGPELSLDLVWRITRPQLENHVDGFGHHGAALLWVHSVHLQICWNRTHTKTNRKPAVRKMVQEGKPARDVHWVVILQADRGRPQADGLS